jgi:hypothetical protein
MIGNNIKLNILLSKIKKIENLLNYNVMKYNDPTQIMIIKEQLTSIIDISMHEAIQKDKNFMHACPPIYKYSDNYIAENNAKTHEYHIFRVYLNHNANIDYEKDFEIIKAELDKNIEELKRINNNTEEKLEKIIEELKRVNNWNISITDDNTPINQRLHESFKNFSSTLSGVNNTEEMIENITVKELINKLKNLRLVICHDNYLPLVNSIIPILKAYEKQKDN